MEGIAGQFGDTPRERAAAAAEALSGTSDRSSREFRNARRNWYRWMRGERHPSAESTTRLQEAVRRRMAGRRLDRLREEGATVELEGEHGATGYEKVRGTPSVVYLSPEQMADVVDAWTAGDEDEAVRRFGQRFGESYAQSSDWRILDVDRLTLRAGRPGARRGGRRRR
jgi:hypothetical protein